MEILKLKSNEKTIDMIKKDKTANICYFFDTDEYASPFDINMAYDSGYDIVIPFNHMSSKKVPKLVQDAIFSRRKYNSSIFFIGGSDTQEADLIAKNIFNSLVPPFEYPIVLDPRGSHSTASAIAAKTLSILGNIYNKKIVILGTGPVARMAALLGTKLKAKIYLVETWNKADPKQFNEIINNLKKECKQEENNRINGYCAFSEEDRLAIIKDANIIWSLAAPGIQILSEEIMSSLNNSQLVIDANLVPPYGIYGLKPKDDNKEIYPGIFGVGALVIGKLKYKIESLILKKAMNSATKTLYDYNYGFEIALKLLNLN